MIHDVVIIIITELAVGILDEDYQALELVIVYSLGLMLREPLGAHGLVLTAHLSHFLADGWLQVLFCLVQETEFGCCAKPGIVGH